MVDMESYEVVKTRAFKCVKGEEDQLMAWLRRNTPLTDKEIYSALTGYATITFEAGHDIGHSAALHLAKNALRQNRIMSWIVFVLSAALIAATWLMHD